MHQGLRIKRSSAYGSQMQAATKQQANKNLSYSERKRKPGLGNTFSIVQFLNTMTKHKPKKYCIQWLNSRNELHHGPVLHAEPGNQDCLKPLIPEALACLEEPEPKTLKEAEIIATRMNLNDWTHNRTHQAIPVPSGRTST